MKRQLPAPVAFALVAAIPAASNILLTLVLVRSLTLPAFAVWSLLEPLLLIFAAVGTAGIQYGVLFSTASGIATANSTLRQAFTVAFPAAATAGLIAAIAGHHAFPDVEVGPICLALTAEALAAIIVGSLRGQRLMGRWVVFELVRSAGFMVIAAVALAIAPRLIANVSHLLALKAFVTTIAVMTSAPSVRQPFFPQHGLVPRIIAYGLPIALASSLQLFGNSLDRFMLAMLTKASTYVASYAAHQRLTGILSVATTTPLNLWFAVEAIRRDPNEEPLFFSDTLSAVCISMTALTVIVINIAPFFWPILFPNVPYNPVLFLLLSLSLIPQTISIAVNVGGLREKKTHVNAMIVGTGIATTFGASEALIPTTAAVGSAGARLISAILQTATAYFVSQRVVRIRYNLRAMPLYLGALISAALPSVLHWGRLASWTSVIASFSMLLAGLWTDRECVKRLLAMGRPATGRTHRRAELHEA